MLNTKNSENKFSFMFIKLDAGENFVDEVRSVLEEKKAFLFSANEFGKQRNLDRLYKEMTLFFEHQERKNEEKSIDNIFSYMIEKSSKDEIAWVFG